MKFSIFLTISLLLVCTINAYVLVPKSHKSSLNTCNTFLASRQQWPRSQVITFQGFENENYDNDEDEEYDEELQVEDSDSSFELNEKQQLGSNEDELQRQLAMQQKQIDQLLSMMNAQQEQKAEAISQQQRKEEESTVTPSFTPTTNEPAKNNNQFLITNSVNPLKAMLFIDGTWLYYSIHEREAISCPIIQKYGIGWQRNYYFDWSVFPRVICNALQEQDAGWAVQQRPIEITRVSVFTSYRPDTQKNSYRFQMYQEMMQANYDVHMMKTMGKSEKCVDINIAVEMLHYATVPNAYDLALLLTGDKDFMPAMIRTRQKGRRVGLVSMRRGCNRALCETIVASTPEESYNNQELQVSTGHMSTGAGGNNVNIRDYEVVWIEDYLDELIKPRSPESIKEDSDGFVFQLFTIMKVVSDFISKSGTPQVSSRDIGRYLKSLQVSTPGGGEATNFLDGLKALKFTLFQFLSTCGCFDIDTSQAKTSDRTFWVSLRSDADIILMVSAKTAKLSSEEKAFFDGYDLTRLEAERKDRYAFTLESYGNYQGQPKSSMPACDTEVSPSTPAREVRVSPIELPSSSTLELPEELTQDFSQLTVPKLKDFLKKNGLKVSGTKKELLARIQEHVDEEINKLKGMQEDSKKDMRTSSKNTDTYLQELIMEYVHAKGGKATSRDIGRYLSANKASPQRLAAAGEVRVSALQELKETSKNLAGFLEDNSDLFAIESVDPREFANTNDPHNQWTFYVVPASPALISSQPQ